MDTKYRGFTIKPKLDFGRYGFHIEGQIVREGFVVTDGSCNVLPGATWSQTVDGAKVLTDLHIKSKGDATKFWNLVNIRREREGIK